MQKHLDEMAAAAAGPLAVEIYEATKNVIVFRDAPGAAIVDWDQTNEARAKIEVRVRLEFAVRLLKATVQG